MNFIEGYFGISPDGGDGSLEIMLLVLLFLTVLAIALHLPRIGNSKKRACNNNRY